MANYDVLLIQRFNPRTRKGATLTVFSIFQLLRVSIHAPVKVRLISLKHLSLSYCSFNPRTREGATLPEIRKRKYL